MKNEQHDLQEAARRFAVSESSPGAVTPEQTAVELENAAHKLTAAKLLETGEHGCEHAALMVENLIEDDTP